MSHQAKTGAAAKVAPLLILYTLFGFAQASNEFRVLFLENQGLSATECGRVLAAAGLLSALSRPLAGALADRLRSRRLVCIGALLFWIAALAALLAAQNVRLASFTLCAGIVPLLSISEPVTYGMIEASGVNATLLDPRLDFSTIRICLSIGYSAINFLYTPIVNRFGPAAPFYCTALFAVLMLLFSGCLRRFESAPESAPVRAGGGARLNFRPLLQNYFLMAFVLLNFIYALGSQTTNYLVYLLNAVGLDGSLVGIATGIRVFGEIVTMPLIPLIKRRISLPMLQAIAGGFVILQIVLYLTCRSPLILLGVTLLYGVSCGITLSTTAVYLRRMAPDGLDTTTLSLSTTMSYFGSIVTNLVGGIVVDSLGIFAMYRICLAFLLLWLLLYFGTWGFGVRVLKKTPTVPMLTVR